MPDAPTSIADHMRTGLVWLPPTIIIVAIMIALELLNASMNRGDSGLEDDHDQHRSSMAKSMAKIPAVMARIVSAIINTVYILLTVAGSVGLILWLVYGDDYPVDMFYFGASFLWVLIASIGVVRGVVRLDKFKRQSRLYIFIFISWPLFPVFFINLGQGDALRDSRSSQNIYISDEQSGSVLEDVNIVRAYGDWLLVRDQQDQVFWIRLDNVDRIDVLDEKNSNEMSLP